METIEQVKIVKFIAKQRKNKKLTQMTLAEKLNITDRAVSKCENGKGMQTHLLCLNYALNWKLL